MPRPYPFEGQEWSLPMVSMCRRGMTRIGEHVVCIPSPNPPSTRWWQPRQRQRSTSLLLRSVASLNGWEQGHGQNAAEDTLPISVSSLPYPCPPSHIRVLPPISVSSLDVSSVQCYSTDFRRRVLCHSSYSTHVVCTCVRCCTAYCALYTAYEASLLP